MIRSLMMSLAVLALSASILTEPARAQSFDDRFQVEIKEVQTRLKALGWYDGAVDGVIGEGTLRAADAYREAIGDGDGQGTIDQALLNDLVIANPDVRAQRSRSRSVASTPTRHAPSPMVRDAQEMLADLGYYDGEIDGLSGPKTRNAIRKFRARKGLGGSTAVDNDFLYILALDAGRPEIDAPGDTTPDATEQAPPAPSEQPAPSQADDGVDVQVDPTETAFPESATETTDTDPTEDASEPSPAPTPEADVPAETDDELIESIQGDQAAANTLEAVAGLAADVLTSNRPEGTQ